MVDPVQCRERVILCNTAVRDAGRLDHPWGAATHAPSVGRLVAALADSETAIRTVVGGGEPTLRPDLPDILSALSKSAKTPLVLATDGLALHKTETALTLLKSGVTGVRIGLHSGRSDAHDWLVGIPGAHRRARRALQICGSVGLDLGAEVVLTRPTAARIEETIALLEHHGVTELRIRMLNRVGPSEAQYITLAPRLGLLQPALDAALRRALGAGMKVEIRGLPRCAVPRFSELCIPDDAIRIIRCAGMPELPPQPAPSGGCPGCPGAPLCDGAPHDYVDSFGWTEFNSQAGQFSSPAPVQPVSPPRSGEEIPVPPPRAGRRPATRVGNAHRQAAMANLGGDPLAGTTIAQAERSIIGLQFIPGEPTRDIRMRLVTAAQEGVGTLRIVGPSLRHAEALSLLRECLRLSFSQVEVAAEASGLASATDTELFHLRGLSAFNIALHGPTADAHDKAMGIPGAFDAAVDLAQRIQRAAGVPSGAFAVIRSPEERDQYANLSLPMRFTAATDAPEREALLIALDQADEPHEIWGPPGSAATVPPTDAPWFPPHLPQVEVD